jgi:hypothetical protein
VGGGGRGGDFEVEAAATRSLLLWRRHYGRYLNCWHFKVPVKATKLPVKPFKGRIKTAALSGVGKSFSR